MGNFLTACCQPSGKELPTPTSILTIIKQPFTDREGKDNLSVSISIGECSEPIKDVKGKKEWYLALQNVIILRILFLEIGAADHKPVNLLATVAQLDNGSSSSEEEQDPGDKDELVKESDDDDKNTTSEEEDSTYEQKNKDESSVMVENGSFSPGDHEASDKDSEEVNEPVTQIEMETRDIGEDTAQ